MVLFPAAHFNRFLSACSDSHSDSQPFRDPSAEELRKLSASLQQAYEDDLLALDLRSLSLDEASPQSWRIFASYTRKVTVCWKGWCIQLSLRVSRIISTDSAGPTHALLHADLCGFSSFPVILLISLFSSWLRSSSGFVQHWTQKGFPPFFLQLFRHSVSDRWIRLFLSDPSWDPPSLQSASLRSFQRCFMQPEHGGYSRPVAALPVL